MITKTHIWPGLSYGQKTPLPLMKDDHIQNCYRRCVETLYGNQMVMETSTGHRSESYIDSPISNDEALKWIPIFQEEAKRRKIKLPTINKNTYHVDLGWRMYRKFKKLAYNRKFDKQYSL